MIKKRLVTIGIFAIVILTCVLFMSSTPPSKLPAQVPINQISAINTYATNTRVLQWKHYFENVQNKTVETKRSREFYHAAVLQQLLNGGIPQERAEIYAEIPDIESMWRPSAVSSHGALGLWQIMPNTAIRYGFRPADMYEPAKATCCAVKYILFLDSLHNGDAAAVLFSYNGGETGVAKQAKAYQTTNYWLVDFASRETYDFAPKVLGAWLHNKKVN